MSTAPGGSLPEADVLLVETPQGPARARVRRPRPARGVVFLGHGAGGGLGAVDLRTALATFHQAGWATVMVEQPWLVAGRRIATPPPTLDAAWLPTVRALRGRGGVLARVRGPLVLGGRSAGARVACRTAGELGADAVLCLSFPLHPPGRPDRSRAGELAQATEAGLPVASVQGLTDPFGTPEELAPYLPDPQRHRIYPVPGSHTIPKGSAPLVAEAVRDFLTLLG